MQGLSLTFTITPSALPAAGTHLSLRSGAKYDKKKSECGFNIYIVGFGGGWVGVEVDGDVHDLQQDEDARREKVLRELGLRTVRFRNDEVVRDLSAVVGKIREVVSAQRV